MPDVTLYATPNFVPLTSANRVVQSLWIGELSPLEWVCMRSFVRCGHEFHLYMYEPASKAPSGVIIKDAREILPPERVFRNQHGSGKGSFAGFSDLFRYHMLLNRGGYWVDMDVFCLRPFDFAAPYVFGAEDKPVATGVIKTPRDCELMRRVCQAADEVDVSALRWTELCEVLTQQVTELDLLKYVLPSEVFSPLVWHEAPAYVVGKKRFVSNSRSRAVHLYHEMWRRNKIDKWVSQGPDSVLEILKRETDLSDMDDGGPSWRTKRGWTGWLPWRRAG